MTLPTTLARAWEQLNARWINLAVAVAGVAAIILGERLPVGADGTAILLSIGCSMLASSLVSWLTAQYLTRAETIREVIRDWGLVAIYPTRQASNRSADDAFRVLERQLDMIGWGFRALRDSQTGLLREKVRRGLQIRILTPAPTAPCVAQRERDECEVSGQIRNTIEQLTAWVASLRQLAKDPEQVQLRHYDALPQDYYFRADGHLFVGPYQWGKISQQTITYEFCAPSRGHAEYAAFFERLWDSAAPLTPSLSLPGTHP